MRMFWIAILSLGILVGSLSAQANDPIMWKCWQHIKPAMKNADIFTYCSSYPDNFTMCPKSIYDSHHGIDQVFVRNINIQNLNKAYKYLCSNMHKIGKVSSNPCFSGLKECFAGYPSSSCRDGAIHCVYKKLSKCSPDVAMLFGKALTMVKSNACTLSSYHYQLKPFYGPEVHCYPEVPKSSATRLGPNYKQFCAEFQKENVSQCIEDNLLERKSFHPDDDYIKEAKEFFRRRSELCEYFSISTNPTCPYIDVMSCQEDLFKKNALQKPFDVLSRGYAKCVHDKYKTCNMTLAKVIKYNLKSNAAHLAISFVLVISHIAIILSQFF